VRRLVCTLGDSTCSVATDNPDAGELLLTETFVELLQNRFAMAVSHPYNDSGVMVCDNHNVFCGPCASLSYRCHCNQGCSGFLDMQFLTICQPMRMDVATPLLGSYSASQLAVRSNFFGRAAFWVSPEARQQLPHCVSDRKACG